MANNLTAVEWLEKKLIEAGLLFEVGEAIEVQQAKEMEKQQIVDCCINTTQDCFRMTMEFMGQEIVFTEQDLINQKEEAEQYYKETFNK
jgi:hypothetical protein